MTTKPLNIKDKTLDSNWAVTRREFLLTGSGALIGSALLSGCGSKDQASSQASKAGADGRGTPWADTVKVVDFAESVHMADLSHYGEFADFGSAARYKYTLGGWMSGWDNDTAMNGMSYTWASKSPSRFYFSVFEVKPLTIVVRAKKGGQDTFSLYLNEKPLSRITLKDGFEDYRILAPVENVVKGENALKLVYQTAEKIVSGAPASFAVDYIRIIPDGDDIPAGQTFDPPHIDGLVQSFKIGDDEKRGLMLPLPSLLTYYFMVPKTASLCLSTAASAGGATKKTSDINLKVCATPVDGGDPIDLLSKNYSGGSWHHEMVDLGRMAGKLVKLDIVAGGPTGGRAVLGEASIRITPPKVQSFGKAKNVIVLLIDTLRADKLTVYNKTYVRSPSFEKFVKESTLFERCQAPANWTKPSCASVLSGLYPDSHKARGHSSKLSSSVKLASEYFRPLGFQAGAFVANGYLAAEFGFNKGWNKYTNFIRENKNTVAEAVFKEALEFIAENKDKPFFTYIQTIDPHVPYDPPDEDLKLYDPRPYEGPVQNRSTGELLEEIKRGKVTLNARDQKHLESLYDGEITYHDRYFGHFLDALKKLGVLDNTVIIVCADHGEEFYDHQSVGHGHTLYQELLHVPLVIRAPGVVPGGLRSEAEVGLVDILPTALHAVGADIPQQLEGKDLLPLCNGDTQNPMEASFSSFYSEADERNLSWAVKKGDFKLRMKGPANTFLNNLGVDPRETLDDDEKYPLALRALRISLGQFIGAPSKTNWKADEIALKAVTSPPESENTEVPDDLKAQLRALGYMQ
jgi:arylsulfatase A-like enzyme